ncbi:hypothetical protein, partial [Mycobacterium sp.]|uniref:hypothetical protein n=1 Tax=Mycobacterium sp. TaxID=1785 RepID=UPI003C748FF7
MADTVDFPAPMPPVSPILSMSPRREAGTYSHFPCEIAVSATKQLRAAGQLLPQGGQLLVAGLRGDTGTGV